MTEIFQWQIDVSTSAPDAGAVDAGADGSSGSVDSGTGHDAAAPDASGHDSGPPFVAADASTSAGGESSDTSGGNAEGCSLGAAALGDWGFVLLVGLGVVVGRKKRR